MLEKSSTAPMVAAMARHSATGSPTSSLPRREVASRRPRLVISFRRDAVSRGATSWWTSDSERARPGQSHQPKRAPKHQLGDRSSGDGGSRDESYAALV